jgi:hypothetical protein
MTGAERQARYRMARAARDLDRDHRQELAEADFGSLDDFPMWTAEYEAEWAAACAGGKDLSATDGSSALRRDARPYGFFEGPPWTPPQ